MQNEFFSAVALLTNFFVQPDALPGFQHGRFPLSQVGLHGKLGKRQIESGFIISHRFPTSGLHLGKVLPGQRNITVNFRYHCLERIKRLLFPYFLFEFHMNSLTVD